MKVLAKRYDLQVWLLNIALAAFLSGILVERHLLT